MKGKILQVALGFFIFIFGVLLGSVIPKLDLTKKSTQNKTPSSTTELPPAQTTPTESAYQTYTVAAGDTLLGISLKFKVSMDELSKLNNLSNANQIKIGQVLKIPQAEGATATPSKIEIDLEKMQQVQQEVDAGKQPWRLDPVEVVKADAPASYEFNAIDTYNLKSKDVQTGNAEVEIKKTKNEKTFSYLAKLTQPVKKGDSGVWAISSIEEVK